MDLIDRLKFVLKRQYTVPAEGLTVLDTPDKPSLDIVFVHGFGGHPHWTWFRQNGDTWNSLTRSQRRRFFRGFSSDPGLCWPADLLPADIQDARIMTFGYESYVKHRACRQPPHPKTFRDIATELHMALEANRREQPDRPLIFVAHSVGGIIVKTLLRQPQCRFGMDGQCMNFESTIGVVFLGTPHSITDPAVLTAMAKAAVLPSPPGVNNGNDAILFPAFDQLRDLRDVFPIIAMEKGWVIHSFKTGARPRSPGPNEDYPNSTSRDVTEFMLGDLDTMSRFSGRSREYRQVIGALKRIITIASHDRGEIDEHRPTIRLREDLLRSLRFDYMGRRYENITQAHEDTCQWFPDDSQYLDWMDDAKLPKHNGVLWIEAIPGAGKSTLMKFLLQNAIKRSRESSRTGLSIGFFFHAGGFELEKSTPGMYRHLLCQILQHQNDEEVREFWSKVVAVTGKRRFEKALWTVDMLQELFHTALLLSRRRVICFIDALDECDGSQVKAMLDFFADLSQEALHARIPFRACFSSRLHHENKPAKVPRVRLDDLVGHRDDLSRYVTTRSWYGFSAETFSGVLRRASGTFLWVELVEHVLTCKYTYRYGCPLDAILEEIPAGLDGLFEWIFTAPWALNARQKDRESLLLGIQWTLFAQRPLRSSELRYAFLAESDDWYTRHKMIQRWLGWDRPLRAKHHLPHWATSTERYWPRYSEEEENLGYYIPLTKLQHTVQFRHQSIRDFLLKDGVLGRLWPRIAENPLGQSYDALKTCCINYIQAVPPELLEDVGLLDLLNTPLREEASKLVRGFPFLDYAVNFVFYHADAAAKYGVDQAQFLATFPTHLWSASGGTGDFAHDEATRCNTLLTLIARFDAGELLQKSPGPLPSPSAEAVTDSELDSVTLCPTETTLTPEALERLETNIVFAPPVTRAVQP